MTPPPGRRVLITGDPILLASAAALRHEVFVGEQGVPERLERDGADAAAVHAVALEPDGALVGTARLLVDGKGEHAVAHVGRVAVVRHLRGTGLGRELMAVLEQHAAHCGLAAVVLHAQLHAAPFYTRLGYATLGEPYQEAGIAHVSMRRSLVEGLRPARDEDSAALIDLIGRVWARYDGCVLDVDGEEPWLRAPASRVAATGGRLWVVDHPSRGLVASVAVRPAAAGTVLIRELKTLYVAAEVRRQGIGERLVRFAQRVAADDGAGRMVLWSDTRFLDAHRLYRRLGWAVTGARRELHDRSATVEIEFGRDLPSVAVLPQPRPPLSDEP